jgi:NADH-quinone oxidoreductase subunit G
MAKPDNTIEMVTITVDGQQMQARKGAMLIEVTDQANIRVPRFCYHEKLSVAANCRMCLVEVEKAPKPLPACATPVMDGMVVHTRSEYARKAQQSVMEFLLINHPLDCPICDQGGECELQDVAMGYGNDVSQYVEGKRVVLDRSIGPLISTELTRCIHCTRCVRFGEEIAGIRELGMTSRGEYARIATYIQEAVSSEMSGNVIDICPVGALTAKPSRFAARAWEMTQHASIAPHDCVGSNIFVHTLRNEVMRVVPRDNEAINETWISDRDRFSYEGVNSRQRLLKPMLKRNGVWQETDWDTALQFSADTLRAVIAEHGAEKVLALVSASSTTEELYLAQKIMRALGCGNIDHRLRQSDFSDQDTAPIMPWLGQNIEDLAALDAALLISSNVRKEQPIIAHRLRQAVIKRGAKIHLLNTRQYPHHFPLESNTAVAQQHLVSHLAAIAKAAFAANKQAVPKHLAKILATAVSEKYYKEIVKQLMKADNSSVVLGEQAAMHPDFSVLRALAAAIAEQTGSRFAYLSSGANTAGAWLAGAVPHRGPAGTIATVGGEHIGHLGPMTPVASLLLNVEPDLDAANSQALMGALQNNELVVAITAFTSDALLTTASVLLPMASFAETSGTYVNAEAYWQSFTGCVSPKGEARPAWKILRVMGNLLGLDGFDYVSSEQVRDELRALCVDIELNNAVPDSIELEMTEPAGDMMLAGDVPMYSADAVLRRAPSLQKTADAQTLCARLNSREAERLGLVGALTVQVKQNELSTQCPLVIDDSIPDGCCWMPLAVSGSGALSNPFGAVSIIRA